MPKVFHAVIKGLRGSWSSGLATLDVEQDGHRLGLHTLPELERAPLQVAGLSP